jgi:hypothetical protein
MAAAIALGATSMSDIAPLIHLGPLLGAAPSGPTVRRALDLAGTPGMLDRIASRPREGAGARLAADRHDVTGFPVAGRRGQGPRGLGGHRHGRHPVTTHSDKQGAAPTGKMGYSFHPLGAWCQTRPLPQRRAERSAPVDPGRNVRAPVRNSVLAPGPGSDRSGSRQGLR